MKIELSKEKLLIEEEGIDEIVRTLLLSIAQTKIHQLELPTSTKTETITKSPDTFTSGTGNTYGFKFSENPEKKSVEKKDSMDTLTQSIIKERHVEKDTKEENTKANVMAVVKEAFETKFDEMKNPNRFNTGSVAITMGTIDKPDIDQIADIDKNICGYDRIRVFDSMERKCDITIINDGSDSLYFIINRNGIDHEEEMWSQAEIMIYPGEAWKIYNVYELRIRSETQGNKYRITEDDIIVGSTIRSVT